LARGFETVALALNDGSVVAGLLLEEFPARIVLRTGDGKTLTVDKTVVEERAQGVSLMPEGLAERMTLRELRDLTAYLQSLRGNPAKAIEGKDMEMK
jgi:quinoprotein glucose dehydrogenase